jgi:integrase
MNTELLTYKAYLINIKKGTSYYDRLKVLFEYLESKEIDFITITKEQLAQYFTDKKYSENSINGVLNSCRDYCKFLNIINHSSYEIKQVQPIEREKEFLDLEEIDNALKNMATYNCRLDVDKLKLILYLMFYTLIRKSELIFLKREDVDLVNGEIKIYEEKSKKENIVPFPEKLIPLFAKYFNTEPEQTINCFNITQGQIDYLFRNVISKYVGRSVSPHHTRHAGIRYLGTKIPLPDIQKMAGHKNIMTTLSYMSGSKKTRKDSYRKNIG